MTASPKVIILDVGHGNCSILLDGRMSIIDCAPGSTLLDTLEYLNCYQITHLFLSHCDADHIGGLMSLLSEPRVKIENIYLNPDAFKKNAIWLGFRIALKDARSRFNSNVHTQLTTTLSGKLSSETVKIEILSPAPEMAASGTGGQDLRGRKLLANSMSAVIGLSHDSKRIALFTGDIDRVGLDNMLENVKNINSEILVFPHHGGKTLKANETKFAADLCDAVRPSIIVFSIGRDKYDNPQPDIIKGVRSAAPVSRITCTQLSKHCSASVSGMASHLTEMPAKGKPTSACCAGSIEIDIRKKILYADL